MTINKFQGKTEAEAVEKAKKEMGDAIVVMNVKEIKPKGLFSVFKSSTFEVTVALEEKEQPANRYATAQISRRGHESINYAADEKIEIPREPAGTYQSKRELEHKNENRGLEQKIENLQNLIQQNLAPETVEEKIPVRTEERPKNAQSEMFRCMKLIYEVLLENDVNERYVNLIMDDVERSLRSTAGMDIVLSNVYQKMILKFGQPGKIELVSGQPKVVFFIGPTGVGKTTTIAKIASRYKVDMGKKVAFLTVDTYRIAAAEQLKTYANILDAPLTIVYSPEEINGAIEQVKDYDLILIDTAGFSHKNEEQRKLIKELLDHVDSAYEKEIFLVLSATTKYKDLTQIADIYHKIADYKLLFTKLDETTTYGNLLNIRMYSGAEMSYVTTGQNVPDDIEVFNTQKIVKQLLGGR